MFRNRIIARHSRHHSFSWIALVALVGNVPTSDAATYTWFDAATNKEWNLTDKNWNTGALAWPNNTTRDQAAFTDSSGQIRVKDGIIASAIKITAGAYTFNAPEPVTLALASSAFLDVSPGALATIGSNLDLYNEASGNVMITGGGTVHITGTIRKAQNTATLQIAGGTTARVQEGGVLSSGAGEVLVGYSAGNAANIIRDVLVVDGGTIAVGRNFLIGSDRHYQSATAIVNSGWVNNRAGVTQFGVSASNATDSGSLILKGGVLTTTGLTKPSSTMSSGLIFDGGKIQAILPKADFFAGLSTNPIVKAGGAKISTGDKLGGYDVTLTRPLVHDPSLGSTKDGGLTKQDHGTLILAPGNTYTGDTVVERGTLTIHATSFEDQSFIHLGANARLNLDFTGADTVAGLYINGQPQSPGTWGGLESGATYTSRLLSGSGVLHVTGTSNPLPPIQPAESPYVGRVYDSEKYDSIPDALLMSNGRRVETPEEWTSIRRNEILELFREHVYGRNAIERPPTLTFAPSSGTSIFSGQAIKKSVNIRYTGPGGQGSFTIYLYIPTQVARPKGIFLLINTPNSSITSNAENSTVGSGSYNYFPVREIIARGYVAVGFKNTELAPDDRNTAYQEGVFQVFGPPGTIGAGGIYPSRPNDAWGVIGAWAWGASRAIDFFKSDAALKDLPVAVVGHSRGGKAALWCGAQDTRVDLTISNSSGSTGAAMARTKGGESVSQINGSFPHWFTNNYKQYNNKETTLPIDQHMLLALCAPRLVYVQSSFIDYHADPTAEFESCLQAGPVYDLFGLGVVGGRWRPGGNLPLHTGHIGYHARADGHEGDNDPDDNGAHSLKAYDWARFMDFADLRLASYSPVLKNWRESLGLDPHGQDDLNSPAGDGVTNLMKYAVNLPLPGRTLTHPASTMTINGSAGLPVSWSNQTHGWIFQFVRRKETVIPGIRYRVDRSEDLRFWNVLETPTLVENLGGDWERVTFTEPLQSTTPKAFYRLRVSTE